jgi:hypothetical protein
VTEAERNALDALIKWIDDAMSCSPEEEHHIPVGGINHRLFDAAKALAFERRRAGKFPAFLKETREARGLTLRDVERITEGRVSNPYLSQLENGHTKNPSAVLLHHLAAAYGVDYKQFMEHTPTLFLFRDECLHKGRLFWWVDRCPGFIL